MGGPIVHEAQALYASSAFSVFSGALRELAQRHDQRDWFRFVALFVRHFRDLFRGGRLVAGAPRLHLSLTDSTAGRAIAAQSGLGRAVLVLPPTIEEYLKGRSRQAVRTNVTHAKKAGIVCRQVPIEEQASLLATFLRLGGWNRDDAVHLEDVLGVHPGEQRFFVAEHEGCPVSLAVLEVDHDAALLVFNHAIVGSPVASPARYALSVCVARALVDEGITHLVVGSALRLAPGLQYFQKRLGFGVWNVRAQLDRLPTGCTERAAVSTPT